MGWSLSWAALKGGDVQRVCSLLGLRQTGKQEGVAESKISGAVIPSGWYVVVFNRKEIKDHTLEKLSQTGEVISCFVEDHVMFSSAAGWKNGRQVWRVAHNGEEDAVLHLDTSGELPAEFEAIRNEQFAKQEQEATSEDDLKVDHVYDIPTELAKKLTGFRHDEDTSGLSGEVFEALEPAKSSGSFLGRLFGKTAE